MTSKNHYFLNSYPLHNLRASITWSTISSALLKSISTHLTYRLDSSKVCTIVNMLQTISIHCRVVTWLRMSITIAICHLSEARQSFPPSKEEEMLLPPHKTSQAGHNTRKHYRLFLCLSHSVNYATAMHFQALPRHVVVPRWLRMNQDN